MVPYCVVVVEKWCNVLLHWKNYNLTHVIVYILPIWKYSWHLIAFQVHTFDSSFLTFKKLIFLLNVIFTIAIERKKVWMFCQSVSLFTLYERRWLNWNILTPLSPTHHTSRDLWSKMSLKLKIKLSPVEITFKGWNM